MSLARLLSDQQARLASLSTLLERECEQLTTGRIDGEALQRLADEKQALLEELERMESLRRRVQERLGYAPGLAGAAAAAEAAGCRDAWAACLARVERTARLNALAGQLLQMRMTHNQQMLDFIREIAEKTLYGPSGKTHRQPGRLNASA